MTGALRRPHPFLAFAGLALLPSMTACGYFSPLYNAQRLFDDAEQDRLAGREEVAQARYDSALTKAGRVYREEPEGPSAGGAAYLLGRIWFRLGEMPRARAAFEEALEGTEDPDVRLGAHLHLGAVLARSGERGRGVRMMNDAMRDLQPGALRAEGHLWRARNLLADDQVGAGWWDLDQAAANDVRLGPAADLERISWGIARDDRERAGSATGRLLRAAPGGVDPDTLASLVEVAGRRWGAAAAGELLDALEESPWPTEARGRLLLLRARLALEAGDSAGARKDAGAVASGFTEHAVPARLLLARLALSGIREVTDLREARNVLLPSGDDHRVQQLLNTIRSVRILVERGRDEEPLALFAAAETARDDLGAPRLSRALFLEYAERADGSPWAGKALLAALDLSSSDAEVEQVRSGLRDRPANPYVRAARIGSFPANPFARLEDDLARQLEDLRSAVRSEMSRDVITFQPPRG